MMKCVGRKGLQKRHPGSSSRDLVWTHEWVTFEKGLLVTSIWGINPGHFEEAGNDRNNR